MSVCWILGCSIAATWRLQMKQLMSLPMYHHITISTGKCVSSLALCSLKNEKASPEKRPGNAGQLGYTSCYCLHPVDHLGYFIFKSSFFALYSPAWYTLVFLENLLLPVIAKGSHVSRTGWFTGAFSLNCLLALRKGSDNWIFIVEAALGKYLK